MVVGNLKVHLLEGIVKDRFADGDVGILLFVFDLIHFLIKDI